MSLEQDIRAEIENIKKLKMEVGNINNHLSALEGLCRGEMQAQADEAYHKGVNDGSLDVKQRVEGAYQRGLEDGKACYDNGCKGCMWESQKGYDEPCKHCCNAYLNQYKPLPKDDNIKVWDVIANNTEPELKVWVTTLNEVGFCGIAITDFGSVKKGGLYYSCSTKGWHKTGHLDIQSVSEVMRNG